MKLLHAAYASAAAGILLSGCGSTASSQPPAPQPPADTAPPAVTAAAETAAPENSVTTHFRGGIGGEKNANNPQPEYFVYRFMPDCVSARLGGGTYQALQYDFSAIFEQERSEIDYYLDDYDGDGHYDLFAPAAYDGDSVTSYAVFIWDPEAVRFESTPVIYSQTEG